MPNKKCKECQAMFNPNNKHIHTDATDDMNKVILCYRCSWKCTNVPCDKQKKSKSTSYCCECYDHLERYGYLPTISRPYTGGIFNMIVQVGRMDRILHESSLISSHINKKDLEDIV
jgi:hypothetical protein